MPPGKFDSDDAPMSGVDDVVPEKSSQTVRGNSNQIVSRVDGDGNIIAGTVVMQQEPKEKRPRLERQLLTQVENEVKDRLRQSLHNQVFIELGKQQAPEQVSRPWDAEVKIGNREPEPIPEGQSILDVFYREDIAGKLLILGHPGAGKTTTMVELAKALVGQAWQDVELPIPVLFNVSGWRDDKQTIAQWLVQELKGKYGVREAIGQDLLDEQKLLPLLDGLDELAPQRQELCAKAINGWLQSEQRVNRVVVCSRLQEYETYETVLELNGAICLQPLKPEQIEEYLKQTGKPEIWDVVGQESDLLELVSIPLWLSVLSLAYRELEPRRWQQLETSQERLSMLLDAYVSSRLQSEKESHYYKFHKIPTVKQTRRWLVWLAQNMGQDEFLIEQMQPSLLETRGEKWQMRLIGGLILGLIGGLSFGLSSGLSFGLSSGLIVGPIGGLAVGLTGVLINGLDSIETIEILKINLRHIAQKSFFYNLIVGLIFGLIVGLILGLIFGLILGLIFGLIVGLILGLIGGLINASKVDIQTQVQPNQGILNSGKNNLFLLTISVPTALFVWFTLPLLLTYTNLLTINEIEIITAAGIAVFFGFTWDVGGGNAYLRHYLLRFVLARSGKIPYLYANFLNYCTERLLLQRVGGRFRFLHRTLQEHFAAMPLEDYRQGMKP